MRKAVIILMVLLLLLASVILVIKMRQTPLTRERSAELEASMCREDIQYSLLLVQAIRNDDKGLCSKIKFEPLEIYCLAWFGKDTCSQLLPAIQKSCVAVLQRNSADCEDEFCHGILGNSAKCTSSACRAVASRDSSLIEDISSCDAIVEKAVRDTACFKNMKSVKDLDDCINASVRT